MLKVKLLTLFKPKNWKQGGNYDQGFSFILTKILFSIECK